MDREMRQNYHNFGCAVILEAVKEYFEDGTSYQKKTTILNDLRKSTWLDLISNGLSRIVAEQLVLHPEEIKKRLKGDEEIDET